VRVLSADIRKRRRCQTGCRTFRHVQAQVGLDDRQHVVHRDTVRIIERLQRTARLGERDGDRVQIKGTSRGVVIQVGMRHAEVERVLRNIDHLRRRSVAPDDRQHVSLRIVGEGAGQGDGIVLGNVVRRDADTQVRQQGIVDERQGVIVDVVPDDGADRAGGRQGRVPGIAPRGGICAARRHALRALASPRIQVHNRAAGGGRRGGVRREVVVARADAQSGEVARHRLVRLPRIDHRAVADQQADRIGAHVVAQVVALDQGGAAIDVDAGVGAAGDRVAEHRGDPRDGVPRGLLNLDADVVVVDIVRLHRTAGTAADPHAHIAVVDVIQRDRVPGRDAVQSDAPAVIVRAVVHVADNVA